MDAVGRMYLRSVELCVLVNTSTDFSKSVIQAPLPLTISWVERTKKYSFIHQPSYPKARFAFLTDYLHFSNIIVWLSIRQNLLYFFTSTASTKQRFNKALKGPTIREADIINTMTLYARSEKLCPYVRSPRSVLTSHARICALHDNVRGMRHRVLCLSKFMFVVGMKLYIVLTYI